MKKTPKAPDPREAWFLEFWEAYKPIRSRARKAALKAFTKIVRSDVMFHSVLTGLQQQKPELLSRDPDKRPYASTWLNGARWEDEAMEVGSTSPSGSGGVVERAMKILYDDQ